MKKRILALLLITTMVITMVGCGSKSSKDGAKKESSVAELSVEENLFDVEVTVPAVFFKGSDMGTAEKEAKAMGVHEVKANDDGSVTYIMNKKTHEELLSIIKTSFDDSIKEILEDKETYPSFTEITYNDDLTQFDVMVDKASYEEFQSFTDLEFYMAGNLYQIIDRQSSDKVRTIVNFRDKDTGEVIESGDSLALNSDDQ
ncbi:hypothetical protein [Clostridium sp. UBA1056]|uniref:hypothetical protein n=1 Tax=unclassified Clostridium TaxID=2614128 RepID=UPI003216F5C5